MNSGLSETEAPFFSIIIPTCNSAEKLPVCLSSLEHQDFRDFEIIVIDNLSSDDTLMLVKQAEERGLQIRWFSERDEGIFDAMNKGISRARGEWLYFLGSDDSLYDSLVLQKIAGFINREESPDVIYGNVMRSCYDYAYAGEFSAQKILQQNICHQAVFTRRSTFKITGLFDTRYKGFADWDHNLKWFLAKKITKRYVDLIIANYGEGGFTSNNWDSVFSNEKEFNYILYGRKLLPLEYKSKVLCKEFFKLMRLKKMKRLMRLVINTPRILAPVL